MERSRTWRCLQMVARIFAQLFFDVRFYGTRHLPRRGGVLLVSNHQSYLDPVLLAIGLDRPLSYMAKSELFKHRAFAWMIRSLNAFPVEQGAGDVGAVKETISRLQEGHVLNIYPEGSRSEDGEMIPLEKGVGLVIRRAKVPVVPAVIDGAHRAWGKNMKFPHCAPVRVMYGPPMDLAGLDRDEIVQKIDQTLRKMLMDLRAGRYINDPPREAGR